MLIDLHCHTQPLSACSSLTVEELIEAARRQGLDGVCLTEHDRLRPADETDRLAATHGLVVLRGMEVTTELGHALVYGRTRHRRGCSWPGNSGRWWTGRAA